MVKWYNDIDELDTGIVDIGIKNERYARTIIMNTLRISGYINGKGNVNMKFMNPYIGNIFCRARAAEESNKTVSHNTGYSKLTINRFESGKGGVFDLMLYYIKFLSVDDVKDICTAILWGNDNG